MNPDLITAEAVHLALRAIRHAKPLTGSPLLRLGALRLRLRHAGRTDSPRAREAQLGSYLEEVVWEHLGHLRGADGQVSDKHLTPERELELMAQDFKARSSELEAWSVVYLRYFAASRVPLQEVGKRLDVSRRTLRRRAHDGHRLLADALRQREATEVVAAQHNLPHPLTRFIGREREIGEVRSLLAEHRLVTLTGAGGIGKSRLAVEVGRALAADYDDGVWLVELGAVADGSHVVSSVASVFDVREQPRRPLVYALTDYLEAKSLLLLLDNCEHLVEACGELTVALLLRCADLQVLVTSRERLHLGGEAVWTVPPLAVPLPSDAPRPARLKHYDAVRLFADRAAMASPGFQLTEENAAPVAGVCTALDGIPLAMELVASRVKVLSVDELAERLGGRFELLHDGRRPLRPHHETLWSTMDWSHALLDEKEQVLFRRLSAFRGGWTLDAAEAVCGGEGLEDGEIVNVLELLVDKSVVEVWAPAGQRRYRLLQTVRQYAGERLDQSDETETVRERHLGHFLALAEEAEPELKGAAQVEWLDRLDAESANQRAAMGWCSQSSAAQKGLRLASALTRYWLIRCHWRDAQVQLEQLMTLPGAREPTKYRAKALNALGLMLKNRGEINAGRAPLEESLSVYRELKHSQGAATALNSLGSIAEELDDLAEAQRLYEESLAEFRRLGDRWAMATVMGNLGKVAQGRHDYDAALAHQQESLAIKRRLGDGKGIAFSLSLLGSVARILGDDEAARAYWEESLIISRELGDAWGIATAAGYLGALAARHGDHDVARAQTAESVAQFRKTGHRVSISRALMKQGDAAIARGDMAAARAHLSESLELVRGRVWEVIVANRLDGFVRLATARGQSARVARLVGAAAGLRASRGATMRPDRQAELEGIVSAAYSALGEAAYNAAYAQGRALTMNEAIAHALDEVTWDELADEVTTRIELGVGEEAQEQAGPE